MEEYHSSSDAPNEIRKIRASLKNGLILHYDLLLESAGSRSFYSITVSFPSVGESAYVRDITGDRYRAEYIFDLVCRGKVTPCCIFEVIEDLIESIPQSESQCETHRD